MPLRTGNDRVSRSPAAAREDNHWALLGGLRAESDQVRAHLEFPKKLAHCFGWEEVEQGPDALVEGLAPDNVAGVQRRHQAMMSRVWRCGHDTANLYR